MVSRNHFDSAIDTIKSIAEKQSSSTFKTSAERIMQTRDSFDIKALVVGHFSSGKSAILNAFLSRPDFLKEAQCPQTAVATELLYDTREQYFIFSSRKEK